MRCLSCRLPSARTKLRHEDPVLQLIPDTEVTAIERCSGHDGTYAVKAETFEGKEDRATCGQACGRKWRHFVQTAQWPDGYADGMDEGGAQPVSMVRKAYGI